MVPVSNSGEVGYCLTASAQQSLDAETETLLAVAHALRGEGFDASKDGSGRGTPIVPVAFSAKDYGGDAMENVSPTLRAGGHSGSHANAGVMPAVAFAQNQRGEVRTSEVSPQLTCGGGKPGEGYPAVAFDMRGREGGAMPEGPHDTAAMRAASGGSSRSYVAQPWAVRRLTPTECHRLQGFPDGFCNIPWRGKDHAPDGPQYKALGNSMAVNCMTWLGERIQMVDGMTDG